MELNRNFVRGIRWFKERLRTHKFVLVSIGQITLIEGILIAHIVRVVLEIIEALLVLVLIAV